MIDLIAAERQVSERMERVPFEKLWPGFARHDFALYDDERVALNGEVLPKTDEFLANTAILYGGRYIAIWRLEEATDPDVLTSKLVHEMFHAFQNERGETRWPDETAALFEYEYTADYLSVKLEEDRLLAGLSERFGEEDYERLMRLRAFRASRWPGRYDYESRVEAIEGTAQFIELSVLAALNGDRHVAALDGCRERLRDPGRLIPIRIICYDAGALLLAVCHGNGIPFNTRVGGTDEPLFSLPPIGETPVVPVSEEVRRRLEADNAALRERIVRTAGDGQPIAEGDFELLGVNVYSARQLDGYILSEYFVMYRADEPVTLYGDYLLRMKGGRIAAIYALKAE